MFVCTLAPSAFATIKALLFSGTILIEWDDEDDYLLYLEEILTRIHKTFFDFNDELKSKKEKNEIPDLKDIISYIKRKVLKGVNVVVRISSRYNK
jgi:hypothetical protein